MNRKISDILLVVLTLVILIIPVITMNHLPDQISSIENRSLAAHPSFSEGTVEFMNGLNSYTDDRIGLREEMMHLYNRWNYTVLRGNHSRVISGKDGWLFYKDTLADYTGTNVDPNKTMEQVKILEAIDTWCKERGIIFALVVGPNKATIYDNYMPDSIYHAQTSNLDMLLSALEETNVRVFCPKDALIAHRDETELYYRQDTHWNEYGSRYLLDEMIAELGLSTYKIPVSESRESRGDLLTMLGTGATEDTSLYASIPYFEGASIEKTEGETYTVYSPNNPSFVCYRDSFTTAMLGYYTYYFNGPVYWTYEIDFDYIDEQRPQYLILSCVERYLDSAIAANAGIANR